ncbi:MAG: hypothetical protein J7K65_03625 [Planctomycetes bacterium]|nr:hypothetical protein [Planctomycetota bacterium]
MKLQVLFGIVLAIFTVHALGGETEVEIENQSSVSNPRPSRKIKGVRHFLAVVKKKHRVFRG